MPRREQSQPHPSPGWLLITQSRTCNLCNPLFALERNTNTDADAWLNGPYAVDCGICSVWVEHSLLAAQSVNTGFSPPLSFSDCASAVTCGHFAPCLLQPLGRCLLSELARAV